MWVSNVSSNGSSTSEIRRGGGGGGGGGGGEEGEEDDEHLHIYKFIGGEVITIEIGFKHDGVIPYAKSLY